MAALSLRASNALFASAIMLILVVNIHATGDWKEGKATYYGNPDGSGTSGGACGYKEEKEGLGVMTVAISPSLFKNCEACGACFEIKCDDKKETRWCKKGDKSIVVTTTNLCPTSDGDHFDLTQPAFVEIAEHDGGIVPVKYRRASCKKKGGIRFTIDGNPNFNLVSISNVGGAGDVVGLEVRGGKKLPWTKMRRNWGQKWQTEAKIAKRKLSFRVTTSDGKTLTLYKVTTKNWEYGQTFESKKNF
ncbi:hypothetical protein LIER_30046 [Lithospermum erythrorhizon]|uniref:Expansin n=1 Tax=Lithospermum erythrorhizon TaxID=34254 RepID=A0AAV3RS63_LITER